VGFPTTSTVDAAFDYLFLSASSQPKQWGYAAESGVQLNHFRIEVR
jgi:hypothetical protein